MEVFWLCFALFWFIVEVFSKKYMGIWFGFSAAATMCFSFFVGYWWIQIPVFLVLSYAMFMLFRRIWKKDKQNARKNEMLDSLVGADAVVIKKIHSDHKCGEISVFGQEIEAKAKRGLIIGEGSIVKIIKFSGDVAVVKLKKKAE